MTIYQASRFSNVKDIMVNQLSLGFGVFANG